MRYFVAYVPGDQEHNFVFFSLDEDDLKVINEAQATLGKFREDHPTMYPSMQINDYGRIIFLTGFPEDLGLGLVEDPYSLESPLEITDRTDPDEFLQKAYKKDLALNADPGGFLVGMYRHGIHIVGSPRHYDEQLTSDNLELALRPLLDAAAGHKAKWRCTWCCKDTEGNKPTCSCGNDHAVIDRMRPHHPHWSRKTINTVECKVCGREGPHEIQRSHELCRPSQPES